MSSKAKQKMADLAMSMGLATPKTESQEAVKPEREKDVKTSALRDRAEKTSRPALGKGPRRPAGGLKQMTIKLEPDVRGKLLQESLRRKAEDSENWPIQRIVTEAVNAYLGGK